MEAILCNRNHPEFGCVTISLPIPDEEYGKCIKLLEALEIGSVTGHDCYVDQITDAPPSLDMLEGTMINVDELDFLARSLDRYTDEELAKFQCMTATREHWDKALHPLRAFLLHPRCRVGVGAQGKTGGGVTRILLHGLDLVPSSQAVHCICVTENKV